MSGPHPAVAACRVAVRRSLADLDPGDRVLVACSGGPDSLALLAATIFEARDPGWYVVGACIDHDLQPGSAEHTAEVVATMAALGADETASARVRVEDPGIGPEAAARIARYEMLDRLAEHFSAATVLLGHTRDDQAETVLLGLTHGSGGRSVAGMRPAFDRYCRPLLDVSRADTREACAALGIEAWGDPHNDDPAYLRSRVRHQVMPVLESEIGPGVAVALARTAALLRPDMEYLDALAEAALADPAVAGLEIRALADLPTPLRTRVLRRAAVAAGALDRELAAEHVLALDRLVTDWHGQSGPDLPGHLRAVREGDRLRFAAAQAD